MFVQGSTENQFTDGLPDLKLQLQLQFYFFNFTYFNNYWPKFNSVNCNTNYKVYTRTAAREILFNGCKSVYKNAGGKSVGWKSLLAPPYVNFTE